MNENMFGVHNSENIENEQLENLLENIDFSNQYIIELNKSDELNNLGFDLKSFKNGVKKMSELCGMITALSNVGVSPIMALQYISNREDMAESITSNEKLAELSNKSNIECAKNGAAFMKANNI